MRVWAGRAVLAAGVVVALCVCAVQVPGSPGAVALTARWTNDYESLLNREASTLPGVNVDDADAPGGVERAEESLLASARKEQDEYIKEKDASGLKQAKGIVRMAAETNAKFGGSFSNGVGSNTWAGTPVRWQQLRTYAYRHAHMSQSAVAYLGRLVSCRRSGCVCKRERQTDRQRGMHSMCDQCSSRERERGEGGGEREGGRERERERE